MSVKLLTEHHLEVLSLKGGCTGLSESTLVKMPHCWKSHVVAHIVTVFRKVVIKFTGLRDWTSSQMVYFHEQRAITPERMV